MRTNNVMKCLIIAAGRGSRLSKKGDSKPLVPLLGLPLIERTILTARKGGINDFYVVTGYEGEKVRRDLDKLSQRTNIHITHIINEEWEKGNGISVLKARYLINEPFILLMADHLFDYSILDGLKREQISGDEIILAVDRNIKSNKLIDIDDVTKVLVEGNKITAIGKNISNYNAYDTGIFLCSPVLFHAIEDSFLSTGDSTLSGGIRILSGNGNAKTFDIQDSYWIDVDDEKAFNKAENLLVNNLKKTSDGPVSRYLNRPLSIRITRSLLNTRVLPNHISIFAFLLGMLGAVFFFLGGYINLMIGGILAQISSVIDGCDGEIARLKFKDTEFGGWFDAVLDRYGDAFLLFGLTYYVYLTDSRFLYLIIGFLAIIGTFMNSYTADKYDGLMQKKLKLGMHYFRMGRDVRIFIIFLGAIINIPLITLSAIAILMNAENIRRVLLLYKNG
jgi:CDP-L-myo-inositol myo-inositolphosphotransferase